MKVADSDKYLGDTINKNGTIQSTMDSKMSKGQGIVCEIMSIINEIPVGRHKTDIALKFKEVLLLNGILYNSEAWHGVTKKHVKTLEGF